MVQKTPYVHWKVKQDENISEIDPIYLWGTVIETDKGPIDEPVFIRDPEQAKKIFNYNLDPYFANGGRYAVVVRAYAGTPANATFDIVLDKDFSYVDVDYDYYKKGDKGVKAKVLIDNPAATKPKVITEDKIAYTFESFNNAEKAVKYGDGIAATTGVVEGNFTQIKVLQNALTNDEPDTFAGRTFYVKNATADGTTAYQLFEEANDQSAIDIFVVISTTSEEADVAFFQGRWRICTADGEIIYYYDDEAADTDLLTPNMALYDVEQDKYFAYDGNEKGDEVTGVKFITKSFNESDVKKTIVSNYKVIPAETPIITVDAVYPGDFSVPITIARDIRSGYRISITDSDEYTLIISGATKPSYIIDRVNERAENVIASFTPAGEEIEKVLNATLVPATAGVDQATGETIALPTPSLDTIDAYTEVARAKKLPIGSIFAKVKDAAIEGDTDNYEMKLTEIVSYLGDGSNGAWDREAKRIPEEYRLEAHQNALDHLATVKLSGIFCNYGEDDLQKVYIKHVSSAEPTGMNNVEVCRWRSLIIGANATDRTNDPGEQEGFKLMDKAISVDDSDILFLGQGLIDNGFIPNDIERAKDSDDEASEYQLLPFQTTQYIAGLRSKLFYGDAIFGGEDKKTIKGVGDITIAPLFNGENKILWKPDVYSALNERGVLTFTEDYNTLSLTDGVTTRQSPLEEDEEGVQTIVKYAKTNIHEALQTYIGRNMLGTLESSMDMSIGRILTAMQSQDQTLVAVPEEGLTAFGYDVVLVPKSNAKQTLAKAYVYLKLTPVHALRQIEVELTVQ